MRTRWVRRVERRDAPEDDQLVQRIERLMAHARSLADRMETLPPSDAELARARHDRLARLRGVEAAGHRALARLQVDLPEHAGSGGHTAG